MFPTPPAAAATLLPLRTKEEKVAPCWREGRENRRSLKRAWRCGAITPGKPDAQPCPCQEWTLGLVLGEAATRARAELGRDGVVALVGSCCPRSPKPFVFQGNSRASDRRADVPAGVGKRPDLLPVPRESREAASGPSPGLARWARGERERAAVQHRGQQRARCAQPRSRTAAGTAVPRGQRLPASPPARLFPGTQVKFGFRAAGAGVKGWLC